MVWLCPGAFAQGQVVTFDQTVKITDVPVDLAGGSLEVGDELDLSVSYNTAAVDIASSSLFGLFDAVTAFSLTNNDVSIRSDSGRVFIQTLFQTTIDQSEFEDPVIGNFNGRSITGIRLQFDDLDDSPLITSDSLVEAVALLEQDAFPIRNFDLFFGGQSISGTISTAVPEPSSVVVLVLSAGVICKRRRRQSTK